MIKVAINGFGRIGRDTFIKMFYNEEYEVVAINHSESIDKLVHLLKYDIAQKRNEVFNIKTTENSITIAGKEVKVYQYANTANLPFKGLDVDVILDTGLITSKEEANKYIEEGIAKNVILLTQNSNNTNKNKVFQEKVFRKEMVR